ncbi:hypothetical protein [Levilactobacillus suantsaii]|nr:hypothetical protein [Levilactobacillus suantsaii]QMU07727.1 hypothetical protein H3M12_09695 [Levilactobacillus suantsaii]
MKRQLSVGTQRAIHGVYRLSDGVIQSLNVVMMVGVTLILGTISLFQRRR